ncbi:MAG TPA: efflux RND transporter periplasmic adaptor subunit [Steroidobacter sp.]|nr:efflux RND transporter periplasmic adaptor subunit [Steroidobacter sp.]
MTKRLLAGTALAIVVLLATALLVWRQSREDAVVQESAGVVQDDSGRRVLYWYDPMVPAQRFKRPGKSPFMDMQLIPKYADERGDVSVRISPSVQQNLGVRLAQAQYARIGAPLTVVGRVEADERRRYVLPSRVSGFAERLLVRAVGYPVSAGEKVAEIYSPELFAAQQEFLALRRATDLKRAQSLVDAARQRLVLFGMAEHEIEAIARSGEPQRRFGVYSPTNGYVTALEIREGAQIEAGAALMSLTDLSSLWLIVEVPEREASRIRKGGHVLVRLESEPDATFSGVIDFVYPALNAQTRTTRVRVNLSNDSGRLRPGMFAHVTLGGAEREALGVPSEAVIYTGSRTLVILKDEHGFRPVDVQTGLEGEGRTEIVAGLSAGEQVVASGQFLIESEASLSGVLARLSAGRSEDGAEQSSHADASAPPAAEIAAASVAAAGKVVSVDHAGGRATLAHEPIPELGWPAMTMSFRFAQPHAVHALSAGDVIRFTLRTDPENGEYVIESATKEASP